MSLFRALSKDEYKKALSFTKDRCELLAKLANLHALYDISFEHPNGPGFVLIKYLDRRGFSVEQYNDLLKRANIIKTTFYKPYAKVAILIANEKYENMSKLATPSVDCHFLIGILKDMGFIVVLLENVPSKELKLILTEIFSLIPADSYCFTFYAGYGCMIGHTNCMLAVDSPAENIQLTHCITDHFVMNEATKSNLHLCVLILNICEVRLDSTIHPQVHAEISTMGPFNTPSNFIIASTQIVCEVVQAECSKTIEKLTNERNTEDMGKIISEPNQYVKSLCARMAEDRDVKSLLHKVHKDIKTFQQKSQKDNLKKKSKIQINMSLKSLHDPVTGDIPAQLNSLKTAVKNYQENNSVSVFYI